MEGHLLMSATERRRLIGVERVLAGEMTVRECARSLGVTERTVQRSIARYRAKGDSGLVHRGRGHPSGRRTAEPFKERILDLCRTEYAGFGPTLAAEKLLERQNLIVNAETLRLWLIGAGLHRPRKSRKAHRSWRERKACFGELVQLDGSVHDWFEGRGPRGFLMSMVDDATGETLLHFAPEETTLAAMQIAEAWVRAYGCPAALYTDRKNVYVTDRKPTSDELLRGEPPLTQFGRACKELGIRIDVAYSPQAKGRVERKHGVCQDRLIKEMRLAGVSSIQEANDFLPKWLPGFNRKFAIPPRSDADLHRPIRSDIKLESIFCRHELRTLQNDWTLRFNNQWLQILADNPLPKAGTRITVECRRNGALHLSHRGQPLQYRMLPERPTKAAPAHKSTVTRTPRPPPDDHPWKSSRARIPEPWRIAEEIQYLAEMYLAAPKLNATGYRHHDISNLECVRHF